MELNLFCFRISDCVMAAAKTPPYSAESKGAITTKNPVKEMDDEDEEEDEDEDEDEDDTDPGDVADAADAATLQADIAGMRQDLHQFNTQVSMLMYVYIAHHSLLNPL
jgi:hypothetical protein